MNPSCTVPRSTRSTRQRIPIRWQVGAGRLRVPSDTEPARLEPISQCVQQYPVAAQQADPHIIEAFAQHSPASRQQVDEHVEVPQSHRGAAPSTGITAGGDSGPPCRCTGPGRRTLFDENRGAVTEFRDSARSRQYSRHLSNGVPTTGTATMQRADGRDEPEHSPSTEAIAEPGRPSRRSGPGPSLLGPAGVVVFASIRPRPQ